MRQNESPAIASRCANYRKTLAKVTDTLHSYMCKPSYTRFRAFLHTHHTRTQHFTKSQKSLHFTLFQSVPSNQMSSQVGSMVLDATQWAHCLVLPTLLQYCVPLLIVSPFPRFRVVPLSSLLVDCFPIPLQVFLRVGHLYCWTIFYLMSHQGTLTAALIAFPPS